MNITIVEFAPETDSVIASYIDGTLYEWGDCYHDKIDKWLDGFINGLKHAQCDFILERLVLSDEHPMVEEIVNLGYAPPVRLTALPLEEMRN